MDVPRLGGKAFEQCAGFLRIRESENPLDASAVHPEAYPIVEKIAADLSVDVKSLVGTEGLLKKVEPKKYMTETIGELTIKDILKELNKPGLDPRSELEQFEYANIYTIEDVKVGMVVPGIVTNITRFGAFIDIGVKQDGLVHVSEIAHKYITDPSEVLKLNDKVQVKVLEVDASRKRIALSIKQTQEMPVRKGERIKVKGIGQEEDRFTGKTFGQENRFKAMGPGQVEKPKETERVKVKMEVHKEVERPSQVEPQRFKPRPEVNRSTEKPKVKAEPHKKLEDDLSDLDMSSALSLLKKKFGK